MRSHRLFVAAFVAACAACSDEFAERTDVDRPRTLAVHVAVQGDPERASPAPGETIDVDVVVADPGPRIARTYAFVVCRPGSSDLDVGVCAEVLPGGRIEGDTVASPTSAPAFAFALPDAATLEGADELLVHGAICAGGPLRAELAIDVFPDTFESDDPCADPTGEGEYVVFRIPLESGAPNHRPAFASLAFDGEEFVADAPVDASEEGCVGGPLPTFPSDREEHRWTFTLADGARESYVDDEGNERVERPFVAFHATDGDFEGAYALFPDEAPRDAIFRVRDDRAPRDVPAGGRLVRFVFVLRDGRGGTSVATRAFCAIP